MPPLEEDPLRKKLQNRLLLIAIVAGGFGLVQLVWLWTH